MEDAKTISKSGKLMQYPLKQCSIINQFVPCHIADKKFEFLSKDEIEKLKQEEERKLSSANVVEEFIEDEDDDSEEEEDEEENDSDDDDKSQNSYILRR